MTGWKLATMTVALVSAAGIGAAVSPASSGQGRDWVPDQDAFAFAVEPDQAVRIVTGYGGSQIGVSIRDLTEDDQKAGKAAGVGVMIDEVEADSPAQKAGFKTGDIIVEFDGERVRSTRQFTRLVQETPSGRQVQTAVLRDGQRVALTVQPRESGSFRFDGKWSKLDELRAMPKMIAPPDPPKPPRFEMFYGGGGRLGITVDDLSSQLGDYFGTKEGVLVTSVNANSAAAKAGLKAGDVITSLNGGAVVTSSDLRRRTARLEAGDEFTLAIVRDKKPMTLKGKLEDAPTRRPTARTII
jgi:serine protease Do